MNIIKTNYNKLFIIIKYNYTYIYIYFNENNSIIIYYLKIF